MEICKITATDVLARYNYEIPMGVTEDCSPNGRMRVLYAPNGRGKTNMLRTLSYLLSPSPESVVALCDAPVGQLKVEFRGGSSIQFRKDQCFETTFELIVADGDGGIRVRARVDGELMSRRPAYRAYRENVDLRNVYQEIQAMHPGAIWIGADRLHPFADENYEERFERKPSDRYASMRRDVLQDFLEKIERLFSSSALRTVARDQNRVYGRLTRTILTGKPNATSKATEARAYLEDRIDNLLERGQGSAKYGLISLSELEGISEQLASVRQNKQQLTTLRTILEPYFEILEKQIEAMEPTRHSVEAFVSSANMFLDEKSVKFESGNGITLFGDNGGRLMPSALSSGERHILLLLAQSVIAADSRKLLVIDEPEISLGIDWQRYLLANLLKCSSISPDSNESQVAQLVVATHSLQVMGEVDPHEIVSPTDTGRSTQRAQELVQDADDA